MEILKKYINSIKCIEEEDQIYNGNGTNNRHENTLKNILNTVKNLEDIRKGLLPILYDNVYDTSFIKTIALEDEMVKKFHSVGIPTMSIYLQVRYSDNTTDKVKIWDDLNGLFEEQLTAMKLKDNFITNKKLDSIKNNYEEQYMV